MTWTRYLLWTVTPLAPSPLRTPLWKGNRDKKEDPYSRRFRRWSSSTPLRSLTTKTRYLFPLPSSFTPGDWTKTPRDPFPPLTPTLIFSPQEGLSLLQTLLPLTLRVVGLLWPPQSLVLALPGPTTVRPHSASVRRPQGVSTRVDCQVLPEEEEVELEEEGAETCVISELLAGKALRWEEEVPTKCQTPVPVPPQSTPSTGAS